MASGTIFQTVPVGADEENTTARSETGSGEIDLSLGETETIEFNMWNGFGQNTGTFSATETGPGSFTSTDDSNGIYTFTITQAEWTAAGSPPSIVLTFGNTRDVRDATYTLTITCFAPGTAIATPEGETAVETLAPGDLIRTADGRDVAVRWVGKQTVSTVFAENTDRLRLVRIAAGALGDGLPRRDLRLTVDHALLIDGLLINAGALVGQPGVDLVPMAELGASYAVYHVETDAHEILLAEGCAAETFIDYAGRKSFDNYADYCAIEGEDRTIRELPYPRISSPRMLPAAIRARAANAA